MALTLGYLHASEAICLTILEYDAINIACSDKYHIMNIDKDGLVRSYFFPIIYNLKHAIELLLKDMIKKLGGNSRGHDIHLLFTDLLEQSLLNNDKLLLEIEDDRSLYGLSKKTLGTMTFSESMAKLENLVNKYYHLEVLKNILGIDGLYLIDSNNSVSRFEKNSMREKLGVNPDYNKILEKVTMENIQEIHSDVLFLLDIEWVLTSVIVSAFSKRIK